MGYYASQYIFHDVDYETDIFPNIAPFYEPGLVRVY